MDVTLKLLAQIVRQSYDSSAFLSLDTSSDSSADSPDFSQLLLQALQNSTGGTTAESGFSATADTGVVPVVGTGDLATLVQQTAQKYGVDPRLVESVVKAESGFNPQAVSPAGAQGLMQLMPGTAKDLGVQDVFDPAQNLDGGVRYLKQMLQKYQNDVPLALAAYNAGPGTVDKAGGIPKIAETEAYIRKVLGSKVDTSA